MQDRALSLVFAFGFHTLVAESRYVASGSMLPTLEVNDRLVIDKWSYRWSNPERGDIIVFSPTEKLKQQNVWDTLYSRIYSPLRLLGILHNFLPNSFTIFT